MNYLLANVNNYFHYFVLDQDLDSDQDQYQDTDHDIELHSSCLS